MADNYIMINGVRLELTPEQVAALTAEQVKDDPFDRRDGEKFYYIGYDGEVECDDDAGELGDDDCYNAANYCRDEEKMKQRALHEILDRLLWRYSEQHGGDPEWDGRNKHWSIYRDTADGEWQTVGLREIKNICPQFCSYEVAEAAIREVVEPFCREHSEFVW